MLPSRVSAGTRRYQTTTLLSANADLQQKASHLGWFFFHQPNELNQNPIIQPPLSPCSAIPKNNSSTIKTPGGTQRLSKNYLIIRLINSLLLLSDPGFISTKSKISMKRYFVFVTVLFTTALYAQTYKIESVGVIKEKKNDIGLTSFGNTYYGVETSAKSRMGWTVTLDKLKMDCKLYAFDKKLELLKENMLADGKDIYGPFSPFLYVINEKLYLLYYNYNTSIGMEIYIASVDPVTLEVTNPKKVVTVDQKNAGLFKAMDLFASYRFQIETSPDRSKIIFFWNPGVNSSYSYSVTDADMNVLRAKSGEVEDVKEFEITNVFLDNDGNFFAGYFYKKKNTFTSQLLAGNKNGTVKKVEIALTDATPHHVYIAKGNSDDAVRVYGTSSKDAYYITGVFVQSLNKTSLKISGAVHKEIPASFVEKFDKDGFAKSKKKDFGLFPEVELENFIANDGSLFLVGDLTRYQASSVGPSTPVKGSTFTVAITNNNEININRIAKKELYGLLSGNNFFAHKWGNKVILLYSDLESNINTPLADAESAMYTSRKPVVMVAAVMDKDGSIVRRIFYPNTPGSFHFSPGIGESIDDNTILFALGKDKIGLTSIKTTNAFYLMKISNE